MPSVIQPWVHDLTYMQQSVLLTAIRGPDGITKEHPAKEVLRWFRRCVLLSAFDGAVLADPYVEGGGSFTGPANRDIDEIGTDYFHHVDEMPHHFQMHVMHAAQIVGFKHPEPSIREWWDRFYRYAVNDLHLFPESEEQMDRRLSDSELSWREAEDRLAAPAPSHKGA